MNDTGVVWIVLLIASATMLRVPRAYYHLYSRLEPYPARRTLKALRQYVMAIGIWFSAWAILQSIASITLDIQSPIVPALLASSLSWMIVRSVAKFPTQWRNQPPYLSNDRAYDAFMKVLADRASEAKNAPEKRDEYLKRLYRDDRVRMQVISHYLHEHQGQDWITLKRHQLTYHPSHQRLRFTLLFILALTPAIIPYALGIIDPTMTEGNASLTIVVTILATVFYSPLFDPTSAALMFGIASFMLLSIGILMEFDRTRPMVPGIAALCVLAILSVVMGHYLQTYVVERTDTPIAEATDWVLGQVRSVENQLDGSFLVDTARNFSGTLDRQLDNIEQYLELIRDYVLRLQSLVGSFFIIPALLFWCGLGGAAIWELYVSDAADVTFHHRMRKPEI